MRALITSGRLAGEHGDVTRLGTWGCWVLLDRECALDGVPVRKVAVDYRDAEILTEDLLNDDNRAVEPVPRRRKKPASVSDHGKGDG